MKHSHVGSGKRQWFAHLAASEGARAGGARGASRGAMSSLSAHALREVWDWHKSCLHLPMVPWAAVPPDPQRLRPRQCQRHRHCEAVSPCSRGDPSTTPRSPRGRAWPRARWRAWRAGERACTGKHHARLRAPHSLHQKMRLAEESAPPRARRAQARARVRARLRSRVRERIEISARACRQRSGVGPGWG